MKNLERSVEMHCSVCGCSQFSTNYPGSELCDAPDDTEMECAHCGFKTTKAKLIEDNSEAIDANIEDMKDELQKELGKMLKKAFK